MARGSRPTATSFRRFVADDLRFQASLGAAAYLVPGLIPADRSADLSSYDRATSSVVEQVCFEQPLPVIATVGFHTQDLEAVQHRLESWSSIYSAVYLQPTPIDPYRDSPDQLGNVIVLLQQIQRQGRDAIAGRMGSLTVLLRALGIAAADAGMAAGEALALNAKLRPQTPSDGSESSTPRASNASRRRASTMHDLLPVPCANDLRALAAHATNRDRRNLHDAPEPHWHALEPGLRPPAQAAHRYLTGPGTPGQPRAAR